MEILAKDDADPKAREIFHEASRTLEMANPNDLKALGETMFQGKIQTYTSITFEPYRNILGDVWILLWNDF